MIPADLSALAPLAALGVAAVLGMLLAPFFRPFTVRVAVGIALLAAVRLAAGRIGLPEAPAFALLADDGLARFGALFAALSGLGALIFLRAAAPAKEGPALAALVALGAAAVAAATHGATLFLGVEIVSVSLIGLFAFPLSRPALEAAYKYLILGGAASAALLFGMALLFGGTGTLFLAEWRAEGGVAAPGAALLLAGLAFKFALAPFHAWTPDAYEGAPAGAAALAAVASKGALALALLRLAAEGAGTAPLWAFGLAAMGAVSILLGNLLALMQTSLPRMLGWSSVAHSGFLAAILASGAPLSGQAALFYLAAYGPALLAAFCVAAALGPNPRLDDLRGLARANPLAGGAFALAMLSLAGLPIASGFLAKLYMVGALAQAERWALLGVALVGSGVGLFYYARFLLAAVAPAGGAARPAPAFGAADRALLLVSAALIAGLGVYPTPFIDLAVGLIR